MNKYFKGLSDLTVHILAFEYLTQKTFKAGHLIMKANKRSVVNDIHKEDLESRTSLIMHRMLSNLYLMEKNPRQNEIWKLMLQKIAVEAAQMVIGPSLTDDSYSQMLEKATASVQASAFGSDSDLDLLH